MNLSMSNGDHITITLPGNKTAVFGVQNGVLCVTPMLHVTGVNQETVTKIDEMPPVSVFTRNERLFLHLVGVALNKEDDDLLHANWKDIYFVQLMGSLNHVHREYLLELIESHFDVTFGDYSYANSQFTLGGLFHLVTTRMNKNT